MAEIICSSLDEAWLMAVQFASEAQQREIAPLTVSFGVHDKDSGIHCNELRIALNDALTTSGRATVETVANTLFPASLWNPSRPRSEFFQRYFKILPTLRRDARNRRGLYFERLINYPGDRGTVGKNQLDHIAATFMSGNHRRSALQAAVFNPLSDLTNSRQQGFPCLHQVALAHCQERGSLSITGFYAMQYLFERAYGNYLGLMRLGEFMAHEMHLKLESVCCIAATGKLDAAVKEVRPLLSRFLGSDRAVSQRNIA